MNSNSVCVDASVAVAWLSYEQHTASANALRREWRDKGVQMVGPPLFHAEVTSTLRQYVYFKRILPEEGEEAFSIYLDIPIRIIDDPEVQKKAWELAKKFNLPRTYDMQYLAVAELENCELWTSDKRLANSLQGRVKRIRWVGEHIKREA